jgi:hypothetical protein
VAVTKKQNRSDELLAAVADFGQIAIVTHDNPDPDAIAAGWAIRRLIRKILNREPRLIGGGDVVSDTRQSSPNPKRFCSALTHSLPDGLARRCGKRRKVHRLSCVWHENISADVKMRLRRSGLSLADEVSDAIIFGVDAFRSPAFERTQQADIRFGLLPHVTSVRDPVCQQLTVPSQLPGKCGVCREVVDFVWIILQIIQFLGRLLIAKKDELTLSHFAGRHHFTKSL